jgi:hypothetical protein
MSFPRAPRARATGVAGAATLLLVLLASAPARADATLFVGTVTQPATQAFRGFAVGANFIVLGFEFEYASSAEDATEGLPSVKTAMGNVYVQTPFGAVQFYGLLGAGLYRESLQGAQETSAATSIGGGAKIGLTGPLRLRLDYRLINLRGAPRSTQVHRVYAGLNLLF